LKKTKLRIGRIPYANLFPIFYYLDRQRTRSDYRFIKGVPSKLNRMLREGKLDISPSSSVEYLRNKDKYRILPCFSISSSGPIESILLFSTLPLEELGGKTIAVSSESDTSVALLKIILNEFLSLKCKFKTVKLQTVKSGLSSFPAFLLIGDRAMKEARKIQTHDPLPMTPYPSVYTYDLAELWHKHTGLPFVFALWIVRKETLPEKRELLNKLSADLIKANKYAQKHFPLIAKKTSQKEWLTEKGLVSYWKKISYNLTEKHMEGLRLFERCLRII